MTRAEILLARLPEMVALKAIDNLSDYHGVEYIMNEPNEEIEKIIRCGFAWHAVPEGHDYWAAVHVEYFAECKKQYIPYGLTNYPEN